MLPPVNLIFFFKKWPQTAISEPLQPCEDTGRRQPSMNQKAGSLIQTSNLPASWSWTSQPRTVKSKFVIIKKIKEGGRQRAFCTVIYRWLTLFFETKEQITYTTYDLPISCSYFLFAYDGILFLLYIFIILFLYSIIWHSV